MLRLSGGSIKPSKSKDFNRLAIFIHVLAIIVVYQSGFWLSIKIPCILALMAGLAFILYNPLSSISFDQIDFQANKWHLTKKSKASREEEKDKLVYEKMRVIMELGLFFLLELSEAEPIQGQGLKKRGKMVLVVFFDQIAREDYRMLRVLEKL